MNHNDVNVLHFSFIMNMAAKRISPFKEYATYSFDELESQIKQMSTATIAWRDIYTAMEGIILYGRLSQNIFVNNICLIANCLCILKKHNIKNGNNWAQNNYILNVVNAFSGDTKLYIEDVLHGA